MATRRQERVNGLVVAEVSAAIRELKDPRIGFVTVTQADVSPDLRHAKVYVSVLGNDADQEGTLDALTRSAGHIRHRLGKAVALKYTPELEFLFDRGIAGADEINHLIKEARASDPNPREAPPEAEADETS